MEENFITVGFICRLPIRDIPTVEDFIKDKGMLVFSKISVGKIILSEEFPISGCGEYESE